MNDEPKPEDQPKQKLPPLKKKNRPVDRNSLTGALFADELIRRRTEQRMQSDEEQNES